MPIDKGHSTLPHAPTHLVLTSAEVLAPIISITSIINMNVPIAHRQQEPLNDFSATTPPAASRVYAVPMLLDSIIAYTERPDQLSLQLSSKYAWERVSRVLYRSIDVERLKALLQSPDSARVSS